jgi:hypothetical protein
MNGMDSWIIQRIGEDQYQVTAPGKPLGVLYSQKQLNDLLLFEELVIHIGDVIANLNEMAVGKFFRMTTKSAGHAVTGPKTTPET